MQSELKSFLLVKISNAIGNKQERNCKVVNKG